MLKVMIGFIKGLGTLPAPWRLWVGLLVAVNMIAPLFYLDSVEARIVLAAMALGAGLQMWIFSVKGFVRLLGIGHILVWAPMLPWLAGRLALPDNSDAFGAWLMAVLVFDGISLVIDTIDVIRYLPGDRTPTLGPSDL